MKRLLCSLSLMFVLFAPVAYADSVQTVGEYNGFGLFFDPGPYQPLTNIGTFTITPFDTAVTISGTFGNSFISSSSGLNLYLGTLLVAQCFQFDPCYNGGPTAFSTSLTAAQIAALGTGTVNLNVLQTSQYTVRLGVTTLTQKTVSPVPEPSSIALLGTGMIGLAGVVRQKLRA